MGEKSKQGADNMKTLLTFVSLFMSSAVAVFASPGGDYPFRPAELADVAVRPGFWLPRFETNRLVTLRTDFRRSEETGRIHNFEAAGRRDGKGFRGIPYDDSDVYKIIEGAAYALATHPDPELEGYLDGLVDSIARAQEPDGYLYTARTLGFNYGTNAVGAVDCGMMVPSRRRRDADMVPRQMSFTEIKGYKQ